MSELEIIPTTSSTARVWSAGARWSAVVMIVGRTTWRNTGSRGGERDERGAVRTKVATRRGASRSPIVETRLSCVQSATRNLIGSVKRRHHWMSKPGALPVRAASSASRIACRTGSGVECGSGSVVPGSAGGCEQMLLAVMLYAATYLLETLPVLPWQVS